MVEYWFPYRDVIGEPWVNVIREFLPAFAFAETRDDYLLAMLKLITRINDTHASLPAAAHVLPPRRECQVPIVTAFVGATPVVLGYSHAEHGRIQGLK